MTLADDIKASWLGLKPHPFPTAGGKQVIPVYLVREDKLNGLILEMQQETDSRDALIRELVEALEVIENTPAWGAPNEWATSPFEVRQFARDALAKAKAQGYEP